MTWVTTVAGIAGVIAAVLLAMHLRVRTRQMQYAAVRMREFREVGSDLLKRQMPADARDVISDLAEVVGSGRITRRLLSSMIEGRLDTPTRRVMVEERRSFWADYPRETRILFARFMFAAILADSYYAGMRGTLLRRTLFFLKNNPAEIAEAVDAMETRILIVGTAEIGSEAVRHDKPRSGMAHA